MKIILLLLLTLSRGAFGACVPIHSDRILGRDLALADPRFAAVPATQTIGFAPAPGTRRTFAAAELTRIARANGLSIPNPDEVCFEISMHQVSEEEVIQAMRRSLPPEASLTIVEMAKADVPVGELDFPLPGLEPPTPTGNGVQLWRGHVKYTDTRKVQVWARVSVTQRMSAVVAARDLPPNVAIDAAAVRIELQAGPIRHDHAALRMEDVVGRIPKRVVRAGSPIPVDILSEAPAVRRGDAVRVEVRSGPTRLLFDAIADKEARNGDMIDLRNPSTGKVFRARLEGSKAVIVIGAVTEGAAEQPRGKQL